ncbi:hypothetical protein ACHQM5_005710 [Ranunculus cassubicifolius]
MHSRRERGLCYNWDDVYSFGHRCKSPQIFLLSGDTTEGDSDQLQTPEEPSDLTPSSDSSDTEIAISINALSGNSTYHTLKLQGTVKNHTITMLIDSGSTHNFVDINTARKLGCSMVPIATHSVSVAGGGHLTCQATCPSFIWSIQGNTFTTEARVIDLGGCDLVLGV